MRMVLDPSDSRPMNTDSPTLGLPRGIVIVPGTPRRACQRTAIWCWAASATPAASWRYAPHQRRHGNRRRRAELVQLVDRSHEHRPSCRRRIADADLDSACRRHQRISIDVQQRVDGREFSLSVPLQCGRIGRQHLLRSPEGYGRRGVDLRAGFQRPGGTVRRPFAQRGGMPTEMSGAAPVMPTPSGPPISSNGMSAGRPSGRPTPSRLPAPCSLSGSTRRQDGRRSPTPASPATTRAWTSLACRQAAW